MTLGLTANLRWLTFSLVLRGFSLGLFMVLWPLYVERLGGGPIELGLLATLSGFGGAMAFLPGGWLADRVDRRRLIFWGSLVAAVAPLTFAAAGDWAGLIPGTILLFGANLARPAEPAMVLDEVPPERLTAAYSVVVNAFEAGMIVGPPVGAWLALATSYRAVFVVAGLVRAVSAVAVLALRPQARGGGRPGLPADRPEPVRPARRPAGRTAPALRHASSRPTAWMALAAALTVVEGLSGPYVIPYWREYGRLSLERMGWLGSVGMLVATVSGPLWGWLADRVGARRSVALGLGSVGAGWVALAWVPTSFAWGVLSAAARAVGEGCQTVVGAELGRGIDRRKAGTAYGVYHVVTEAGRGGAALPGGLFFEASAASPFWITAAVSASMALWLWA